jgi:hypothetical protein
MRHAWPSPGKPSWTQFATGQFGGGRPIYDETTHQEITDLLMGHSVVVAGADTLRLDDGTELQVIPNEGACSCSDGDYAIGSLAGIENVITRVELAKEDADDGGSIYRIFVYAGNERVNLVEVEGGDGSGYYGTGYEILVKPPE